MKYLLGHDIETRKPLWVPAESFRTHWHFIGGTGKGKTTSIETLLRQILLNLNVAAHFVFDRLGGLSQSLLMWFASPYCPPWVRDRVIYIDAAREDIITTFNPLLFDSPAHGYYKTQRACECVLRGWASQDIEQMPRLARWVFNTMWAAAQLGLTVADCAHLLMPGSPLHHAILARLPDLLRAEWEEIAQARGGEAVRTLESARNRMKPYFENPTVRCMFGSVRNRLDVGRFLREGRIVIVNLSPQNRLTPQLADAIGGMLVNEILATVRSQPVFERHPCYLWLDEFQRFVGPDIEEAIPEVRQLDCRLALSHQSFSQLQRGETDLTSLIWQAQSRMIMGVQGEDADLLAHEIASLTFDANRVKDEMFTRRQMLKEQRIIELASWSESEAEANSWNRTYGSGWSKQSSRGTSNGWNDGQSESESVVRRLGVPGETRTLGNGRSSGRSGSASSGESDGQSGSQTDGEGGSLTRSKSRSVGQSILPVYEEFRELTRKSYYSFEEQRALWAKLVRHLGTGEAIVRLVDDPKLHRIKVQRHAPGYLGWDISRIHDRLPQAVDRVLALVDRIYQSDVFVSPQAIERETAIRLEQVLNPVVRIATTSVEATPSSGEGNPLL